MAASRCCVSFIDSEGPNHSVQVDAESVYKAVATAFAQFQEDSLLPAPPNPSTEVPVAVLKPPAEHKIRLKQVEKWAKPYNIGGPAGIIRRQKGRAFLGKPE